jgi:hypothetical protein
MRKLKTKTSLLFISALMIVALSCKEDETVSPNSPKYQISESEKLDIPAEIQTSGTRVATYYAKGHQIYRAQQSAGSASVYEWVFVSPIAELFDETNKKVGDHFAGPTWQLIDGSKINAQLSQKVVADQNSIEWLLLVPKSGTTATGVFSGVTHIQRIATTGGKAPSTAPTGLVGEIGVEYTAVYRVIKAN